MRSDGKKLNVKTSKVPSGLCDDCCDVMGSKLHSNLHSKSESWVANESVCMEVLGV